MFPKKYPLFNLVNLSRFLFSLLFFILQLKENKGRDGTDKPCLSLKSLKTQRKTKPPDAAGAEIHTLFTSREYSHSAVSSQRPQSPCWCRLSTVLLLLGGFS